MVIAVISGGAVCAEAIAKVVHMYLEREPFLCQCKKSTHRPKVDFGTFMGIHGISMDIWISVDIYGSSEIYGYKEIYGMDIHGYSVFFHGLKWMSMGPSPWISMTLHTIPCYGFLFCLPSQMHVRLGHNYLMDQPLRMLGVLHESMNK